MNIADEFAKMGHETKLVVLEGNTEIQHSDYEHYGVDDKFEINKIAKDTKIGKIKFILVSLLFALKFKPNIVVTRFPLGAYVFLIFGFKVVLDAHHPVWKGSKYKNILYKIFKDKKNLIKITTNSKSLKDMYYEENMQPKCNMVVAHNGSKIYDKNKFFEFKQKSEVNIGYIGSVYNGRGIDIVLEIAKKIPDISFHIAGGSEKELRELKSMYDITKNVIFYGYINPSKAYMFRNSCDILLAPYHRNGVMTYGGKEDSSKYMNPIKVIEYLSSGKSIIASDLKPIREVLNDDIAFLADPDDISQWCDGVLRIVSDKEYAAKLAQNAYDYFLNNYSWKIRADKLLGN